MWCWVISLFVILQFLIRRRQHCGTAVFNIYFCCFTTNYSAFLFYIFRIFSKVNGDFSFLKWWPSIILDLVEQFLGYCDFPIFKIAAVSRLGLLKCRNFIGRQNMDGRDASSCQIQNRSIRCRNTAIFQFIKMAESAILDCLGHI